MHILGLLLKPKAIARYSSTTSSLPTFSLCVLGDQTVVPLSKTPAYLIFILEAEPRGIPHKLLYFSEVSHHTHWDCLANGGHDEGALGEQSHKS